MSGSAGLSYYKKNRDVILNRAKDHYKNDKGKVKKTGKK